MNMFERAILDKDIKCDICGEPMLVMYGGGWDNDRIVCSDQHSCGAEIVYPTTTIYEPEHEENSGYCIVLTDRPYYALHQTFKTKEDAEYFLNTREVSSYWKTGEHKVITMEEYRKNRDDNRPDS